MLNSFPILLTAALLTAAAFGGEIVFTVEPGDYQNVTFHSKAPLESFEGVTNQIFGSIQVNLDSLAGASAVIKVDMQALDTGINLRNKHMRDNHLHTADYPFAEFSLKRIEGAGNLKEGEAVEFNGIGDFTLHGVTREISVPLRVKFLTDGRDTPLETAGNALHIKGEFQVKLSDYEVPRPKFLVMKLNEVQRVTIELWAKGGE